MKFSYQEEVLVEELVEEAIDLEAVRDLVVFNDDVNTFDHVIHTLVKVCNHTHEQAEQCSYIIHFRGKCTVKNGIFPELVPMRQAIVDAGISAEIL